MTYQILLALMGFAFVTSITPGPNNLMLMTSGANFGFRRTLPHLAGVTGGFVFMAVLMGLGLSRLFDLWPPLKLVLKGGSLVYMLWLAWKIAQSPPPGSVEEARPMTFLQACAFQWVNPKAWAMAITAMTAYVAVPGVVGVVLVAAVFGAVNLPSCCCWVVLGREMRRVLTNPARFRAFNWGMAGLLVATLWPLLTH
jgi:threonine/homoserine/homoserine lactone efflux protein